MMLFWSGDIELHPGLRQRGSLGAFARKQDVLVADLQSITATLCSKGVRRFEEFLELHDLEEGVPSLLSQGTLLKVAAQNVRADKFTTSAAGALLSALSRHMRLACSLGAVVNVNEGDLRPLSHLHRSLGVMRPAECSEAADDAVLVLVVYWWIISSPQLSILTLLAFHCLILS